MNTDSGSTHPSTPPDAALLARYCIGETTAEESAAVGAWLESAAGHRGEVERLRLALLRPDLQLTPEEIEAGIAAVVSALSAGAAPQPHRGTGVRTMMARGQRLLTGRQASHLPSWVAQRAVPAAVVLGAALLLMSRGGVLQRGDAGRGQSPGAVAMRTIATRAGQRSAVTLSDGTEVALNAASTLRVPVNLRESRTVELDGEALFTVTHRGGAPFIVRSGPARVTVLGTMFAVRRYPEDHGVRVAVAEGRVSIRVSHADATLGARAVGRVSDTDSTLLVTPEADVKEYTDWARGRVVFRNTPLRDAIPELERRYGLTIRLADSALAAGRLTATVSDAQPSEMFDLIAMTFGMRYARDGNVVTFFRARAATPNTTPPLSPRSGTTYGK